MVQAPRRGVGADGQRRGGQRGRPAPQAAARSGRPASIASAVAATRRRSDARAEVRASGRRRSGRRSAPPPRRTAARGTPSPRHLPHADRAALADDARRARAGRRRRGPRCAPCARAAARAAPRVPSAATASGAVGRPSATHPHAGREAHAHRGRARGAACGSSAARACATEATRRASGSSRRSTPPRVAVEGRRRAVAPEALEARRAVEASPARRRPRRRARGPGVSGATLTHASARHARAAGGAIARAQPRSPSCWSRTRPRERAPVTTRGRSGSSPVVRSKR